MPRAIVVGAGIGGLTAALALRAVDIDVLVLERAEELSEVGAGISLWPNAIKVLRDLGIGTAIEKAGRPIEGGGLWDWRGRRIKGDTSAEFVERFGAPLVMIHRGVLQRLLRAALPGQTIRHGAEVGAGDQDGHHVHARLVTGGRETGDLVIGADGLHSRVRTAVARAEPPLWSGLVAWRGIAELDALPGPATLRPGEHWGPGALFGMARVDDERAYWWTSARASFEGASPNLERAALATRLGDWAAPIPQLVRATPASRIIRTGLYDRDPESRWSTGLIALLGDAAHPMLPFLGQGACQAIEDAAVLADSLRRGSGDLAGALELYARRRYKRVGWVVKRSRSLGRVAHLSGGLSATARNAVARATPASATLRHLRPLLAYEVNATEKGFELD